MATEAKTALVIEGVDRTAGAFSSIGARAAAASARLRGVLGGALAAAGAYMGFRQIASGINELGHLSDIAQKTNTDVGDLTRTAQAMDVLGIQNMGVDQFAKAMDYMQKTTGRVGMEGFYQTLEELGKIEDTAKRGQEAMKIFGRSGMEFMPLINGATDGVAALRGVIDVMPGIPQSAADAGDAVADAMNIASNGFKSVWLQAIGAVCGWFDTQFTGGVREAALLGAAYLEYYAKVGASNAVHWYQQAQNGIENLGAGVSSFFGALAGGASVKDAFGFAREQYEFETNASGEVSANELIELEKRQQAWKAALDERKAKIAEYNENMANAAKMRQAPKPTDIEADDNGVKAKSQRVQNKLMLGDSNELRKLSILGPSYQAETKKQTALLKRIAENTKKADATGGAELKIIE